MNLLDYSNFYLVGIKGVAMTSLAQILVNAGKNVSGCDVDEDFVTQDVLSRLKLDVDTGFDHALPENVDCLIFTAAHGGSENSLVQKAKQQNIICLSQAEALSSLFNSQDGVAVCGVGGKSTISAMIAWIMVKTNQDVSFSVGVGNIPGLEKTGQWSPTSQHFVAEADEYVIDPKAKPITPRFSFLTPKITVCSNLKFDHPDVYHDFNQTKQTFLDFFNQIKDNGTLIINGDDNQLVELVSQLKKTVKVYAVGKNQEDDLQILDISFSSGQTLAQFIFEKKEYQLNLIIPGEFNARNALMAVLTCAQMGIGIDDSLTALSSFASTMRRFEYLGEKHQVKYYDDYAHHPDEVASAINAINDWYPDHQIVIAFQPHTYSRTKALLDSFVSSLSKAENLILLDIFASAREENDPSISSKLLKQKIELKNNRQVVLVKDYQQLADYCINNLQPGTIVITLGAGDIYKAHQLIIDHKS